MFWSFWLVISCHLLCTISRYPHREECESSNFGSSFLDHPGNLVQHCCVVQLYKDRQLLHDLFEQHMFWLSTIPSHKSKMRLMKATAFGSKPTMELKLMAVVWCGPETVPYPYWSWTPSYAGWLIIFL